jgi:hypothetical protein
LVTAEKVTDELNVPPRAMGSLAARPDGFACRFIDKLAIEENRDFVQKQLQRIVVNGIPLRLRRQPQTALAVWIEVMIRVMRKTAIRVERSRFLSRICWRKIDSYRNLG